MSPDNTRIPDLGMRFKTDVLDRLADASSSPPPVKELRKAIRKACGPLDSQDAFDAVVRGLAAAGPEKSALIWEAVATVLNKTPTRLRQEVHAYLSRIQATSAQQFAAAMAPDSSTTREKTIGAAAERLASMLRKGDEVGDLVRLDFNEALPYLRTGRPRIVIGSLLDWAIDKGQTAAVCSAFADTFKKRKAEIKVLSEELATVPVKVPALPKTARENLVMASAEAIASLFPGHLDLYHFLYFECPTIPTHHIRWERTLLDASADIVSWAIDHGTAGTLLNALDRSFRPKGPHGQTVLDALATLPAEADACGPLGSSGVSPTDAAAELLCSLFPRSPDLNTFVRSNLSRHVHRVRWQGTTFEAASDLLRLVVDHQQKNELVAALGIARPGRADDIAKLNTLIQNIQPNVPPARNPSPIVRDEVVDRLGNLFVDVDYLRDLVLTHLEAPGSLVDNNARFFDAAGGLVDWVIDHHQATAFIDALRAEKPNKPETVAEIQTRLSALEQQP